MQFALNVAIIVITLKEPPKQMSSAKLHAARELHRRFTAAGLRRHNNSDNDSV